MNKHTPGPWRISTQRTGMAIVDRFETTVAAAHKRPAGFKDDGEQRANARIIAAAPDLLEVVRDIVSDCERGLNPGLYALAVAALAKAEGRE